jgi:hypothetical protein
MLQVYFFKGAGRAHAFRKMFSRPMVGDRVVLRDGEYIVEHITWPFRDDNDRDSYQCNVIIKPADGWGNG